MNRIYDYVVAVTTRYPDSSALPFTSPVLLAHDVRYDIEHNELFHLSEEELLRHIDLCLHSDDQQLAFRKFKQNYRAWLRRHKK